MRSPSSPLVSAAVSVLAALALVPRPVAAQELQQPVVVRGVAATPEGARAAAAFARAQRLVAEGQGAAGRAVVDSTIAATDSTSPVFAEGIFWRASLAAAAADAERDYRTLAVEYPLSPRSADALLRLAQLEMARGDRALAVKHLERLTLEHPTSPARPRASYWMARVYFESADVPHACAALDAARAGAAPNEIALRGQIDAYAPRCKGVAAPAGAAFVGAAVKDTAHAVAAASAPSTPVTAASPATAPLDAAGTKTHTAAGARVVARDTISIFAGAALPSARTTTPASVATSSVSSPAPTRVAPPNAATAASRAPAPTEVLAAPFPAVVATSAASISSPASSALPASAPHSAASTPAVKPAAASVPGVKPGPAAAKEPARSTLATAAVAHAPAAAPAPNATRTVARVVYAVQIAAFDAAAPAEALAARLRARGMDARVSGAAAPFRVRVGHYATSGAAAREAAALKARGQPAWVVTESATPAGGAPGASR